MTLGLLSLSLDFTRVEVDYARAGVSHLLTGAPLAQNSLQVCGLVGSCILQEGLLCEMNFNY